MPSSLQVGPPNDSRAPTRVPVRTGASPEGEELSRHAVTVGQPTVSGEESREKLTNPVPLGSEGPLEETKKRKRREKPEGEITRVTCKFRVDVASQVAGRHKHWNCGGPAKCKACYLDAGLAEAQATLRRGMNLALRALFRADGDWLDEFQLRHGRMPDKTELKWVSAYSYALVKRCAPAVLTGTVAAAGKRVDDYWKAWRYETLIGENRAPPLFTRVPIPLRADNYQIRKEGDAYRFSFSIFSKEQPSHHFAQGSKQFSFLLWPKDAFQKLTLAALASGEWKAGEALLQENKKKPGTWFLGMSYRRIVTPVEKTERVAAINRGLGCFLAIVTNTGEDWVYSGNDVIQVLKQFQARRRGIQNQIIASGDSRRGHGVRRALRPTNTLAGKAARWRTWKINTLARRLGEWLVARDISVLYMEDFAGIRHNAHERLGQYVGQLIQEIPWYQLGQRITSVCEELGIRVVEVSSGREEGESGGIAETCPACGHVDRTSIDYLRRSFRCTKDGCGFRRHLDVSTALNVMIRGEHRAGVSEPETTRKLAFLKGHKALRGPSTDNVMAMPEVSEGGVGTSRKRRRKR